MAAIANVDVHAGGAHWAKSSRFSPVAVVRDFSFSQEKRNKVSRNLVSKTLAYCLNYIHGQCLFVVMYSKCYIILQYLPVEEDGWVDGTVAALCMTQDLHFCFIAMTR